MKRLLILTVLLMIMSHLYSETDSGKNTFYFYHSDIDWAYCDGDEMWVDLSLCIGGMCNIYEMNYDLEIDAFYTDVYISDDIDYVKFSFMVNGTPIGDMRDYLNYCEPYSDYFVDDGKGGFEALVLVDNRTVDTKTRFEYTLTQREMSMRGGEVVLTIVDDYDSYTLEYDSASQVYYGDITPVYGKACEVWLSVFGEVGMDMRDYGNRISPAVFEYSDDGYDGYNALFIFSDDD